jgi:hypothetical protein
MKQQIQFAVKNHVEGKLQEGSLFDWRHLANELAFYLAVHGAGA